MWLDSCSHLILNLGPSVAPRMPSIHEVHHLSPWSVFGKWMLKSFLIFLCRRDPQNDCLTIILSLSSCLKSACHSAVSIPSLIHFLGMWLFWSVSYWKDFVRFLSYIPINLLGDGMPSSLQQQENGKYLEALNLTVCYLNRCLFYPLFFISIIWWNWLMDKGNLFKWRRSGSTYI